MRTEWRGPATQPPSRPAEGLQARQVRRRQPLPDCHPGRGGQVHHALRHKRPVESVLLALHFSLLQTFPAAFLSAARVVRCVHHLVRASRGISVLLVCSAV